LIKGVIYERLTEFERDTVAYLESLSQMSLRDLLDAKGAPAVLERYLSKLFINLLAPLYDLVFVCCYLLVLYDWLSVFLAEDMSTLTPAKRLKFLERARAKKTQPDNKVDVLSQLEGAEGDKKKRKIEPARIRVPVSDKVSSPAAAAADEAAEAGGRHKLNPPPRRS
jgi:hypothetical protein